MNLVCLNFGIKDEMRCEESESQTETRGRALKESNLQHQIQSGVDVDLLRETLAGGEQKSETERNEEKHIGAWCNFYLLLLQVEGQSLESGAALPAPLVTKH